MHSSLWLGFPGGSAGKESACNAGDLGSIPGLGRSPGGGIGYPLQYSGLANAMDYIVRGVAKSRTRLSDFHCPEVRSPCHRHHPRVELFASFQANITHPLKQPSIPLPQPLAPTVALWLIALQLGLLSTAHVSGITWDLSFLSLF